MVNYVLRKILGTKNERELKKLAPLIGRVKELEPRFEKLTQAELQAEVQKLKQQAANGRSLDDILKSAVDNKIPLYFVRTNYEKEFGQGIPDAKWREAVEKTGGRYYVAKNEASLIAAVDDIDREAAGKISARQYVSQEPRFTEIGRAHV